MFRVASKTMHANLKSRACALLLYELWSRNHTCHQNSQARSQSEGSQVLHLGPLRGFEDGKLNSGAPWNRTSPSLVYSKDMLIKTWACKQHALCLWSKPAAGFPQLLSRSFVRIVVQNGIHPELQQPFSIQGHTQTKAGIPKPKMLRSLTKDAVRPLIFL